MTNAKSYAVQVTAPHFCAGILIRDGYCYQAAPILKWCIGHPARWLALVFKRKGWATVVMPDSEAQASTSSSARPGTSHT
jgi:hypothetical protein